MIAYILAAVVFAIVAGALAFCWNIVSDVESFQDAQAERVIRKGERRDAR